MIADRKFQLIGPYADIHRELMSHDPNWRPANLADDEGDDLENLPIYKISLEGPAGTGKTFFEGVLIEDLHQRYPRLRSVVIRKTRVSLTDSWMQVFEDDVLQADHPAIARRISRANRQEYRWTATVKTEGGGVTRLAGMDHPTRLFSTQYDIIIVVEAIEFTHDEYQSLFRALRNTGAPFKAVILDTNPGNVNHWLNREPDREGSGLRRVRTKHRHNPAYVNPRTGKFTQRGRQYMEILDGYTGVMRRRMRDGEWCSAEGAIYPQFDATVGGPYVFDPGEPDPEHGKPFGVNCPDYEYFIAGIDFGHLDATCLQVWGVTADRDSDMLAEWYGAKIGLDLMAKWVQAAFDEFKFVRCVGDHRPELIEFLNQKFGWREGKDGHNLVMPAQKGKGSVVAGLELVSDLMGDPEGGKRSRIRFSSRARRYTCPIHTRDNLPIGVVEEIPGYVWAEQKEGRPARNEPDPGCVDHGCDAARYVQTEIWVTKFGKKLGSPSLEEAFKPQNITKLDTDEFENLRKKYLEQG